MASDLIASTSPAVAPVSRRVRAFFAPVNRVTAQPTLWDPAGIAGFNPCAPPAPWVDLGWCSNFVRTSSTQATPIAGGAPAVPLTQVRTAVEASVSLEFESWGKLPLALTAGVQQMNVLRTQTGATANGSGGTATAPVPLGTDSTATTLDVGIASSGFTVGEVVAVDLDYTGQTAYVGSGVSGGYVKSAAAIGSDPDYIRRITLNVGRVVAIAGNVLTLGAPLLAGTPVVGMKVSHVAGFCDREGGSFFQEWSALFVLDGEQGDRIVFHYPRLQAAAGPAEKAESLAASPAASRLASRFGALERVRLAGTFRALPVKDANDGEQIVCFRSYLPGPMRAV
jgi:uncharacterized membrane protein